MSKTETRPSQNAFDSETETETFKKTNLEYCNTTGRWILSHLDKSLTNLPLISAVLSYTNWQLASPYQRNNKSGIDLFI